MVINNGASKASETKSTWRENGSAILEFLAYIAFIMVLVVCIGGMVICFNTFITNSKDRQEDTARVAAEIKKTARSDSVSVDTLIKHLDTMVDIQKRSTANDLMAFIYGMLSSILVGLCGGFVLKSKRNADDAKTAAGDAKTTADKAKTAADSAKQTAGEANNTAKIANNSAIALTDEIKKLKADLTKAEQRLQFTNKINHIKHLIALAELNVINYNQHRANDRIREINEHVKHFCEKCGEYHNPRDYADDIKSLIYGLSQLRAKISDAVDDLEATIKPLSEGSMERKKKKQKLQSMQQSKKRYDKSLNESIAACESVLKTQS